MKLATKRLILRPFTSDDFTNIHNYSSKKSVTKYMEWGPNTQEETLNFLNSVLAHNNEDGSTYDFMVTLKETGTVIGACGVYFKDNEAPFLGWVYDDVYWNKGYGTEVGRALLSFVFNKLNVPRIEATCHASNIGSKRIMEKIGMRYAGERSEHNKKLGNHTVLLFELTSLEYKLNNHRTFI